MIVIISLVVLGVLFALIKDKDYDEYKNDKNK